MARKTAALEMDGGGAEGKVAGAGTAEPGAGGGAAASAEANARVTALSAAAASSAEGVNSGRKGMICSTVSDTRTSG